MLLWETQRSCRPSTKDNFKQSKMKFIASLWILLIYAQYHLSIVYAVGTSYEDEFEEDSESTEDSEQDSTSTDDSSSTDDSEQSDNTVQEMIINPSSRFRDILGSKTFVDKTLLIKDFLEFRGKDKYVLFTSPRGFGKSTNLDMLREFVQLGVDDSGKAIKKQDSSGYKLFTNTSLNLAISQHKDIIDRHLGAYPTIYLDLYDVIGERYQILWPSMKQAILRCIQEHSSVYDHMNKRPIPKDDMAIIRAILDDSASDDQWKKSITALKRILFKYFNKKIIVIVDNYDTPITDGIDRTSLSLDAVFKLLTKLFDGFDMNTQHVEYAFLSGLTGIGKTQSNSLSHKRYMKDDFLVGYFGLTKAEFDDLLRRHKVDKAEENRLKQNYKPYKHELKSTNLYHTYSITKHLQNSAAAKTELIAYWERCDMLRNLRNLYDCTRFREDIVNLIFNTQRQFNYKPRVLNYEDLKELKELSDDEMHTEATDADIDRIYTFFFDSGYLISVSKGNNVIDTAANDEIRYIFERSLQDFYMNGSANLYMVGERLHSVLQGQHNDQIRSNLTEICNRDFASFLPVMKELQSQRDYTFEFRAIIYIAAKVYCSDESAACDVAPAVVEPGKKAGIADVVVTNKDKSRALIIKVQFEKLDSAVSVAKEYKPPNISPQHITYMGINVNAEFRSRLDIVEERISSHARVRRQIPVRNISMLTEVKGDVFESNRSMAYCVPEDFEMKVGIAVQLKRRFGGQDELLRQKKTLGEVAVLKRDGKFIFYLIIKKHSYELPTMTNLKKAVNALVEACMKENITALAMPRIGCGVDKLNWNVVKDLIQNDICGSGIDVTVYNL